MLKCQKCIYYREKVTGIKVKLVCDIKDSIDIFSLSKDDIDNCTFYRTFEDVNKMLTF